MWPDTDGLSVQHLNNGTDSPSRARPALFAAVTKLLDIIRLRGQGDGICDLGEDAKVPPGRLGKGEAGGVCELDDDGSIPAYRYDAVVAGAGLAREGEMVKHADTSRQSSVVAGEGKAITNLSVDEFGHATLIQTGVFVTALRWSGQHGNGVAPLQAKIGGRWYTVSTS